MSGYFGTPAQQRLQALAEERSGFVATTPGACQTGRTMGCDDIDALGWDRIQEFLDSDEVCGFRLLPCARLEGLRSQLAARNFRLDTWDVFVADRDMALAASQPIVSRGPPSGLRDYEMPSEPENEYTGRIQGLMGTVGVVPFSGSFLVGSLGPATTQVVGDDQGNVVAAAHGYMPHNRHSKYANYAWGGLVAVAPSQQGRGLGNYVNARMVMSVFDDLAASHIYELVSASNVPSRRMVAACGLRQDPDLFCGLALPDQSVRFTR